MIYKLLEKKMGKLYTCYDIIDTLKAMNFADIREQGFIPLYERTLITDKLHGVCGFRTDFTFITKQKMKAITLVQVWSELPQITLLMIWLRISQKIKFKSISCYFPTLFLQY
jgi:hypothetical protein